MKGWWLRSVYPAAIIFRFANTPHGRERELLTVKHLLLSPDTGLVTLTGTGGCGKTRLGLQVASELLHRFEERVYFVALASITDPAMVPWRLRNLWGSTKRAAGPF